MPMKPEQIENPLIGAITKENYDNHIKMKDKLYKRAEHLYGLLELGDSSETILKINFYHDTVQIDTWYTYMGEYDENTYDIPSQYMYMNDNEVLEDVARRKKEEKERQEQEIRKEEEKIARLADEKKKKRIDAIKESVSIVNTNLTPEELDKMCENIYQTIIDNEY